MPRKQDQTPDAGGDRESATATRDDSTLVQPAEGQDTRERGEDAPDGAPEQVSTPRFAAPGPDVSNADVDLAGLSLDAGHSTYHENPDPNPLELRPAPGPSVVQVLGEPTDDPVENKFEATR